MTQDEYIASVEWIRIKKPNHPLLKELGERFSAMNVIYCKKIIEQIDGEGEVKEEVEVDELDPQLLIEYRTRSTLFGRRAKLSNKFHDCTTDTQRANLSDDIQEVQRDIEICLRNIRIYKATGNFPETEDEEEELTGVALMMKYRSVIANISIKKRNINTTVTAQDEATLAKRKSWESQLKKLQDERIKLERKIASESI